MSVAYGANAQFFYQDLTGGTPCNNTVFGDPIPGTAKACYTGSSITTSSTSGSASSTTSSISGSTSSNTSTDTSSMLALASSTSPTGNVHYVAPNGSDSNPGTLQNPFRTIARGISALGGGDTLLIRGGTYNEGIISVPPSGTAGAPTWIGRYQNETVIIQPPDGTGGAGIGVANVSYITYDGLILDGVNQSNGNNVTGLGLCCYGNPRPTNIVFQNGEIKNWNSHGAEMLSDSNTIRNTIIHHNALCTTCPTGQQHGLYITGNGNLLAGNQVYDNGGYGFHVYGNSPNNSNNIIRNNVVYGNGWLSSQGGAGGFGILLSSGSNNQAYNNVVYGNGVIGFGGGIQVGYGCTNCLVYNNTIYGNTSEGIQNGVGTSATNTTVKNNISRSNGGASLSYSGTGTTESNNLCDTLAPGCSVYSDPLFVNASQGNFALQATSPAKGAGTASIAPNVTLVCPASGCNIGAL